MSENLDVFDAGTQVGTLEYDAAEDRFSFQYAEGWQASPSAYDISPHIRRKGPKHEAAARASPATVRRFIENLLPEGRALDVAAGAFKLSKSNIYGLIRQLGQETAGALCFAPAAERPSESAAPQPREVLLPELHERIRDRAELPFSVWDGRVRLSLAGMQDKMAVYEESGRLYLVGGPLASTHILKPEPLDARSPMLVVNEHFGMRLAQAVGIKAAKVTLMRVPDPVLMVERFDRQRTAQGVRRRHIIDACQALDLPVSYKYERNLGTGRDVRDIRDGASFARLFSLADLTVSKALSRMQLLRWMLYQFVLGNSDAHGKNLSFFSTPSGLELAPAYDLVCVAHYPAFDRSLAMAFGDEFDLEQIKPYDFAMLGARTAIPRSVMAREMQRLAHAVIVHAPKLLQDPLYEEAEKQFLEKVVSFTTRQAHALQEMAPAVTRLKLDS